MGTLISCHRTPKVSAKAVSTQATDCVVSLQPADCVTQSATDGPEAHKTIVTELNMGDGDSTIVECIEHEYPVNRRADKENKPRRGVHRSKSPPEKKGISEIGLDGPLKCDYLLLPGQVSSKDGSPQLGPRADKLGVSTGATSSSYDANDNTDSVASLYRTSVDQVVTTKTVPQTYTPCRSSAERFALSHSGSYQDENSNIVQGGSVATHQIVNATSTVIPNKQQIAFSPHSSIHGYDSRYMKAISPRKKSVLCKSERPPHARNPGKVLPDLNSEFVYSLEEAFQRNVPCCVDILEAAAVTGTPSSKLPPPPSGKYPVSLELKMMMRGAGGDPGIAKDKVEGQGAGGDGRSGGEGIQFTTYKNQDGTHCRSSDEVNHSVTVCQEDKDKQCACPVQADAPKQASKPLQDAERHIQSAPSVSTLTDSPEASDVGSTKSTVSTDVEHGQGVSKEKSKRSAKQSAKQSVQQSVQQSALMVSVLPEPACRTKDSDPSGTTSPILAAANDGKEPKGETVIHQEQEKAGKTRSVPVQVSNTADAPHMKQPYMSYQAIQEAVGMAILKLSKAEPTIGRDFKGSDASVSKTFGSELTVEVDGNGNASPEEFRHPDDDHTPRQDRIVYPSQKETSEGNPQISFCVREDTHAEGGSVLADSKDKKTTVQEGDGSVKDVASEKVVEGLVVESEDWDVVPLHRVSGQTNLRRSGSSASQSSPEIRGSTSRSLPPSAGSSFTKREPGHSVKEIQSNALSEDQMISIALNTSRKLTAESYEELRVAQEEEARRQSDTLVQVLSSKQKACNTETDGMSNRAFLRKSPRMMMHHHLQLAEDVYPTGRFGSPIHDTTSTPKCTLSPVASQPLSLPTLLQDKDPSGHSSRSVPLDTDKTCCEEKQSDDDPSLKVTNTS